jgi:hypothetical protein
VRLVESKKKNRPRIDQVVLEWFGRHELEDDGWVSRVLAAIGEHLPACMPVRFNIGVEPPRKPFAADGPQRVLFEQMCRTKAVTWSGAEVGYEGYIRGLSSSMVGWFSQAKFNSVQLNMDARFAEAALADGGLKPIVVAMAEAVGAVYVYGCWARGLVVRAGELWSDSETDSSWTMVTRGGEWQGLPWDHVWLEWFGPDYVPLVEEALAGLAVPLAGGLLAEYGWDQKERFRRMPRRLITESRRGGRAQAVPPGW